MMTTILRRSAAKGFTLIELLIVVIIIAILAAIAIPQFSNTSGDAQESASIANLTTMRSAIELYRVQHNNTYPTTVGTGSKLACSDTTGLSSTPTFKEQLTKFTDVNGNPCNKADPSYTYGPYLRDIPVEPITNSADVAVDPGDNTVVATDSSKGWRFVKTTGVVQINSTKKARDGATLLNAK